MSFIVIDSDRTINEINKNQSSQLIVGKTVSYSIAVGTGADKEEPHVLLLLF